MLSLDYSYVKSIDKMCNVRVYVFKIVAAATMIGAGWELVNYLQLLKQMAAAHIIFQ